jgi:hypothetical protein
MDEGIARMMLRQYCNLLKRDKLGPAMVAVVVMAMGLWVGMNQVPGQVRAGLVLALKMMTLRRITGFGCLNIAKNTSSSTWKEASYVWAFYP